jgi:alkanesulfonate monooxygenase SsuD/methylene tetrahydromethanopterin reductase-like flavin-dependent oxidoreductase (luciferase family)
MRIGVVFPQTELGGDAGAVRAYGQRVEELGFTHLLAYDHVVGADPAVHAGWDGPYDVHTTFHEPLVMFGYLAAVTTTLELVTGVIILPQRQAVLVAKQAAEVDLLSEGRLRLGVGLGWNAVEYEALNEDFTNRGKRLGEQIDVMRRLWTEPTVTFDGQHHRVTGAGLAPLPVQRPIPVWVGAFSQSALEAGRDPSTLGMEGRVTWRGDLGQAADQLAKWTAAGATHVSVNTMGAGLRTVDEHLAGLTAVAENLSA